MLDGLSCGCESKPMLRDQRGSMPKNWMECIILRF